jgi:hypothetical protein
MAGSSPAMTNSNLLHNESAVQRILADWKTFNLVMAGLDPAIHDFLREGVDA